MGFTEELARRKRAQFGVGETSSTVIVTDANPAMESGEAELFTSTDPPSAPPPPDTYFGLPLGTADLLTASLLTKYSQTAPPLLKRRAKDPSARAEIRKNLDSAFGLLDERDIPRALNRPAFLDAVLDDITGYGPITAFMTNKNVVEIMVNRPDQVVLEFIGRGMVDITREMGIRFRSTGHIVTVLQGFAQTAGKSLDDATPMVDLRTPEGNRLFGALGAVNRHGPSMTIRRRVIQMPTLDELERRGTMNGPVRRILETALADRITILITGGTGSGKTTTLNALAVELGHLHRGSRFVTVEDPNEIALPTDYNWVAHEARPGSLDGTGKITILMLVRVALRERPDFVIVGEVRGGEAFALLQAWNTGHEGSPASLHANSAEEAVPRLVSLALMGMPEMPVTQIREMIGMVSPLLVHQERLPGRRVVSQVSQVVAGADGALTVVPIAAFDRALDDWVFGEEAARVAQARRKQNPLDRFRGVWEREILVG